MRRSWLALCALLAIGTLGCDKIKDALNKRRGRTPATPTQTAANPRDTTKQPTAGAPGGQPVQQPVHEPPPPPPEASGHTLADVPYVSEDTGTVAPGMAEREVYALWGAPAAVRRQAEWTYLFFRNGCEKTCGTMDVVILQNGQVVDAIVRWPGHGYSGESSSPPGRKPKPTRRGDTLTVPNP
jgi:hypothetical protein